jgi:hypothetical protein
MVLLGTPLRTWGTSLRTGGNTLGAQKFKKNYAHTLPAPKEKRWAFLMNV